MASFAAQASGSVAGSSLSRSEHTAAQRARMSSSLTYNGFVRVQHPSAQKVCGALSASRPQARKVCLRAAGQAGTSTEAAGPSSISPKSLAAVYSLGPVTDKDWEEKVLKSPVPVIVDFWAPWCGPCRMIAPMIDEIAVEYGEKIRAFKLNTDESPSIATDYGIRSIPTVMVFKGGKKMDAVIGAVPKSTLVQSFDKFVE